MNNMLHTADLLRTQDMTAEQARRAAECWRVLQWDQRNITDEESRILADAVKILTSDGFIEKRFQEDVPLYIVADYEFLTEEGASEEQQRAMMAEKVLQAAAPSLAGRNISQGIRVLKRLRDDKRYESTPAREQAIEEIKKHAR